jgi:hypothetical protein
MTVVVVVGFTSVLALDKRLSLRTPAALTPPQVHPNFLWAQL